LSTKLIVHLTQPATAVARVWKSPVTPTSLYSSLRTVWTRWTLWLHHLSQQQARNGCS